MVTQHYLEEFYEAFIAVDQQDKQDKQQNLDLFKEMVDYAIKNKLDLYFNMF